MSSIETARGTPSLYAITAIAHGLGIDPGELIAGIPRPPMPSDKTTSDQPRQVIEVVYIGGPLEGTALAASRPPASVEVADGRYVRSRSASKDGTGQRVRMEWQPGT